MKMYLGRVNGYAMLMLFIGIVGNHLFGWKMLLVAVPLLLVWLMSYDEASYEYKQQRHTPRKEVEVIHDVVKR